MILHVGATGMVGGIIRGPLDQELRGQGAGAVPGFVKHLTRRGAEALVGDVKALVGDVKVRTQVAVSVLLPAGRAACSRSSEVKQ